MKSVDEFLNNEQKQQSVDEFLGTQNPENKNMQTVDEFLNPASVLPKTQITQSFGNYNPSLEVFSGGKALDTNFAANPNTPVHVPHGQWYVISAYTGAAPEGYVGNPANEGYGNDVMIQNTKTGDKLHFIHLAGVNVKPGQIINGAPIVGMTGSSGNATGPNLGVEYYNSEGKLGDVMQSPYAQYFNVN